MKTSPKTEKKICKQVGINASIVSPAITSLMLRGYVETSTRKRMFFWSAEYFSITIDGLAAFQASVLHIHPLTRAIFHLKNILIPRIFKNENQSSSIILGMGAIKLAYWLVKRAIGKWTTMNRNSVWLFGYVVGLIYRVGQNQHTSRDVVIGYISTTYARESNRWYLWWIDRYHQYNKQHW